MTLTPGGRACRSPKARVPGKGFCPAGEVLLRRRGFAAGGGLSRRRGFITPERPPLCEGAAPKGLLKAAAPGGQGRPFRAGGRLPFGEGGTIPAGLFRRGEGPLPGCPPPRERAAEGLPPETAGKVQLFWTRCVSKGKTGPEQPGAAAGPKRPTPLWPGAKPGRPLRAGGRSAGGCSPLPQNPRKGGCAGRAFPLLPLPPGVFPSISPRGGAAMLTIHQINPAAASVELTGLWNRTFGDDPASHLCLLPSVFQPYGRSGAGRRAWSAL